MIAKIVPFARLPHLGLFSEKKGGLSFFDYLIPKELENKIKYGQLVEISFRQKNIQGLVIGFKKTSKNKNLKEVKKIFLEEALINKEQFVLFKWLSSFYFASLSTVLKTSLPQPIKRKKIILINNHKNISEEEKTYLKVSKTSLLEIKKNINFVEYSQRKKFLLLWQSYSEKIALFYFLIKKAIERKERVLILVPSINEAKPLLKYLNKISFKIVLLYSGLKKSEVWQNWQTIINDQADIVLGTRIAIFAPIKKLSLIIVENEENELYKSEQFPYYDARDISWKVSKMNLLAPPRKKIKLIFSSTVPRVKTYHYAFFQNKFLPLEFKKKENNKNVCLVNMNQEIRQGNFSPLSEKLEEEILKNIRNSKKTILYLKRKGYASFIFCQDCGRVFKCPRCDLSLKAHKKNKSFWLTCHHCGYNEEIPLKCPSCSGVEIKIKGIALEKISEVLEQHHQHLKGSIAIIDQETKKDEEIFLKNKIIITTKPFWQNFNSEKNPWLNNLGSVAIISADILLSQPDYRSSEKTFQELSGIINWAKTFKIDLLIQSWSTNNYAITEAINNNLVNFYNQELETRKDFNYPPFVRFFRLTIKERSWNRLKQISYEFEEKIKQAKGLQISSYSAPPRRKKMFEKNYLIKIKNLHPVAPLPNEIKKILPSNYFLDPL